MSHTISSLGLSVLSHPGAGPNSFCTVSQYVVGSHRAGSETGVVQDTQNISPISASFRIVSTVQYHT